MMHKSKLFNLLIPWIIYGLGAIGGILICKVKIEGWEYGQIAFSLLVMFFGLLIAIVFLPRGGKDGSE